MYEPVPTLTATSLTDPSAIDGTQRNDAAQRAVLSHLTGLTAVLDQLRGEADRLTSWSRQMAECLVGGGRVLAAGNGGSAAEAQHLTAELVGRYDGDRRPFSAIALHAETSSLTAIANDYPADELFARQVEAHGRPGDVVVLMSTSGRSPNIVAAAERGRAAGLSVLAMTGPAPNPLAMAADESVCIDSPWTATVQECHLVALHLLCAAFDQAVLHERSSLGARIGERRTGGRAKRSLEASA